VRARADRAQREPLARRCVAAHADCPPQHRERGHRQHYGQIADSTRCSSSAVCCDLRCCRAMPRARSPGAPSSTCCSSSSAEARDAAASCGFFGVLAVRAHARLIQRGRLARGIGHVTMPGARRIARSVSTRPARRAEGLILVKAGGTRPQPGRRRHVVHYDQWWQPADRSRPPRSARQTDRPDQTGVRARSLIAGSVESAICLAAPQAGSRDAIIGALVRARTARLSEARGRRPARPARLQDIERSLQQNSRGRTETPMPVVTGSARAVRVWSVGRPLFSRARACESSKDVWLQLEPVGTRLLANPAVVPQGPRGCKTILAAQSSSTRLGIWR